MSAFCPLCAHDDYTETGVTPDGRSFAVCHDRSHGSDGFVWEPTPPPGATLRGDGLGSELGIWDKLLECLEPGEEFVPYGVVEDRFFERFEPEATQLLHKYGHRFRDPAYPSTQYSMSAYLASRLRELQKEGHLELRWEKATGPWAYNGTISAWRRP